MEQTLIEQLKNELQKISDRLIDSIHGTDQYGYRAAMEYVIKYIDTKLIPSEKERDKQIAAKAWDAAALYYVTKELRPNKEEYLKSL